VVQWERLIVNNYINAAVTGFFLVMVALIVIANARMWWLLLSKRRELDLREAPYVRA